MNGLNGSVATTGAACVGGAGSGGSLLVTTPTISGTGLISANGGHSVGTAGGGGGGRISIRAGLSFLFTGQLQAYGGQGYDCGGSGTIYFENKVSNSSLIIDNGNIRTMCEGRAEISGPNYWEFTYLKLYRNGNLMLTNPGSYLKMSIFETDGTTSLTSVGSLDFVSIPVIQNDITTQGRLVLSENTEIRGSTVTPLKELIGGNYMKISNGGTLSLSLYGYSEINGEGQAGYYRFCDVDVENGTIHISTPDQSVVIQSNSFRLSESSTIDLDYVGFPSGYPGPGSEYIFSFYTYSPGASHGG